MLRGMATGMSDGERNAGLPVRSFYSRPTTWEGVKSFFFVPLAIVLGVQALRYPEKGLHWVFLATSLLAWASLWVTWRRSLPWQGPALTIDGEGMRFWPWRKDSVFMPWSDLKSIGDDPSDQSLIFHPVDPAAYERPYLIWLRRPPYTPRDLKTRDGEHFIAVVGDYFEPMR